MAKSPLSLLMNGSPTIVMSPVIGTANALGASSKTTTAAVKHVNVFNLNELLVPKFPFRRSHSVSIP